MINVTQSPYNAAGDGVTDDRLAIQDAIDDAGAAGGGKVYLPAGTYLLDSSVTVNAPSGNPACLVIESGNVFLEGDGRGATRIKLGDNTDAHIILVATAENSVQNGGVRGIEIDGNRSNQTLTAHAVRSGGDVTDWTLEDFYIHEVAGYGVGLQYGALNGVTIQNGVVEDTGSDGIDIKNFDIANVANKMHNVTVRRAGLNTSLSGQTCFDVRGIWNLSNLYAEEFNHSTARCLAGIRFRPDGEGATGGNLCTLSGFYVNSGTTSGTIGLQANGYQCSISSGVVQGCGTGVEVNGNECTVGNVIAKGCADGFVVGAGDAGDRVILDACIARSCSASGFKTFRTNTILSDIVARSNVHGVNLRNGSVNTIISGLSSSNSGSNLNKESTGLTWTNTGFTY